MDVVLFDIDGTLIRTGGAGVRAFAQTSALLHGRPGGTDGMTFHGRTDTSLVREYLRLHGLPDTEEEIQRFLDVYVFLLGEELRRHAGEVCPGVEGFMAECRRLRPAPVMGLLTGNIRLGAELKLRAHGLWEHFELGGFADDHEDRDRIAEAAWRRAEQHLGRTVSPGRIVVIGDTPKDIGCARAIGARVLAVATGGFDTGALRGHDADWTVEMLDQIRVEELLKATMSSGS